MSSFDSLRTLKRSRRQPTGVTRDDSDDELGVEDHPWEWIYAEKHAEPKEGWSSRKRKRVDESQPKIIGARMGSFECALGDTVFLKAEGSGEAWIAIICDFQDDVDGEKTAHFMWFSSEKEIRNKHKKRSDNLWVSASSGAQKLSYLISGLWLTESFDAAPQERAVHYTILGLQPISVHQRQGQSNVTRIFSEAISQWENTETLQRLWQSLCMSSRMQHQNCNLHRRIHLGRHLPGCRGHCKSDRAGQNRDQSDEKCQGTTSAFSGRVVRLQGRRRRRGAAEEDTQKGWYRPRNTKKAKGCKQAGDSVLAQKVSSSKLTGSCV